VCFSVYMYGGTACDLVLIFFARLESRHLDECTLCHRLCHLSTAQLVAVIRLFSTRKFVLRWVRFNVTRERSCTPYRLPGSVMPKTFPSALNHFNVFDSPTLLFRFIFVTLLTSRILYFRLSLLHIIRNGESLLILDAILSSFALLLAYHSWTF